MDLCHAQIAISWMTCLICQFLHAFLDCDTWHRHLSQAFRMHVYNYYCTLHYNPLRTPIFLYWRSHIATSSEQHPRSEGPSSSCLAAYWPAVLTQRIPGPPIGWEEKALAAGQETSMRGGGESGRKGRTEAVFRDKTLKRTRVQPLNLKKVLSF